MRKFVSILLTTILVVLVMAACSSGGGNQPDSTSSPDAGASPSPGEQAPEKVTISIYYPTPDQPENRALEDDKIRRFTEQYPHVEIIKSDWQYSPDEIGIKMGANEAPTLFNTYATEGRFLAERGWAADITVFYNEWAYHDQMNPILQDQFLLDGKVYGLAQQGYVTGVVLNKKMLEDAGVSLPPYDWTWDDLYNAAAETADPASGISGIAPMGQGNEAGWNWTNFFFEAGGEIQEVTEDGVTAAFNSDAAIEALEFYDRLRWEAEAIPQDWALNWGGAVGAFAQGRTAMVIAGADGPVDQALNQGGMLPEDVLVYPMPAYEQGGKHTGVLGGDFLVINPNASEAEQEMAFKYATFDYFSDKGLEALEINIQEREADGKYYIPPVIEYFEPDSEYGQKVRQVYEQYDNVYQYSPETLRLYDGKPEAQFSTQEFYAAMTNIIQQVFSERDTDFQSALDDAAAYMQTEHYDHITFE